MIIDLKALVFQFADQLKIAERVQIAKKIINYSINLIVLEDEIYPRPTAILTATTQEKDRTNSILVEKTIGETDEPLQEKSLPFTSGTHFIVDNPDWWQEREFIDIGQIRCIPVTGKTAKFNGIRRPEEEISVSFLNSSDAKFVFGLNPGDTVNVNLCDSPQYKTLIGSSQWTFTKYTPDQVIRFTEISRFLFSLDKEVAKTAIVIKRESKQPKIIESYLLVLQATSITTENK